MVTTLLGTDYHQQDTDYYCGAACAQMILDSIGAGVLDQVALYNDNHSHSTIESGWYTGPDGLTWTLNDRRPAAFNNYFVLMDLANEDQISRKIVWTIHHYGVAPAALVYGWAHWIVVHGYDVSAHPSAYNDTSYSINAFEVNNPWPPTPMPGPPPPHTAGDVCGSGGTRGTANQHITYATWQTDYMTGVPGGHWNGRFLAVCDPEPPPDRYGDRRPPRERPSRDRLVTPREAVRAAESGFKDYELSERDPWRKALRESEAGDPVLVERLDRPGTFYYIVPWERRGRWSAAAAVDARFGDYLQATSIPRPGVSPLADLDVDSVVKRLAGELIQLPEPMGQIRLLDDLYCVYPTLVWRPCRESLSPFYPFRMITIGARRVYIRTDGRVFTKLTTNVRGI
jgi:hypothetical protein